jgi:hypothetical protein
MSPFLVGAVVGGFVMLRWRREIETYIGQLWDVGKVGNAREQRTAENKASERPAEPGGVQGS